MWLTISENRMSKPLFFLPDLVVNGEIFSTKYLLEIVAIIEKNRVKEDAHFATRSMEEVERHKINVVPKNATLSKSSSCYR